jgi:hypothetical protein
MKIYNGTGKETYILCYNRHNKIGPNLNVL